MMPMDIKLLTIQSAGMMVWIGALFFRRSDHNKEEVKYG